MPALVITEVCQLIGLRLGWNVEIEFIGDLAAGTFTTLPTAEQDWLRIAELVATYRDLPLGTVDASVVAAAERLGLTTIATFDRRHFGVVRPEHADAFDLVP